MCPDMFAELEVYIHWLTPLNLKPISLKWQAEFKPCNQNCRVLNRPWLWFVSKWYNNKWASGAVYPDVFAELEVYIHWLTLRQNISAKILHSTSLHDADWKVQLALVSLRWEDGVEWGGVGWGGVGWKYGDSDAGENICSQVKPKRTINSSCSWNFQYALETDLLGEQPFSTSTWYATIILLIAKCNEYMTCCILQPWIYFCVQDCSSWIAWIQGQIGYTRILDLKSFICLCDCIGHRLELKYLPLHNFPQFSSSSLLTSEKWELRTWN